MEWQQQQQQSNNNGGMIYVKVMTDEQMELLRKQISIYATLCEQLVEMHKAQTQHDFSGMRLGNMYCDSITTSTGHKISTRQRWTPTPMQLQMLERIFDQGTGTPSKQKIKDITNDLIQHGPISETNVYNWFQNRRARSKRKQTGSTTNNGESEVETEVESPREKRGKSDNLQSNENHAMEDNELESLEPLPLVDGCAKSSGSLGDVSFYDSLLSNSNPRIDQLMGKMEVPGNYYPYRNGDGFE
ncbi:hypothetical protein ACHQM5_015840 [Ranunculus cassubicifolius]